MFQTCLFRVESIDSYMMHLMAVLYELQYFVQIPVRFDFFGKKRISKMASILFSIYDCHCDELSRL